MKNLKKDYILIPASYLLFGVLWIFYTDSIVNAITQNPETIRVFQSFKGWLFVGLSTTLIFLLLKYRHYLYQAEKSKREKVFHKTVEGACHIILNYLNQMNLINLEAEKCHTFDQDVLKETEKLSDDALKLLRELDQLEIIESEEIEALIYKDLKNDR